MGYTRARGIGSAQAAVGILHRKELTSAPYGEREALHARLVAKHERTAGGVDRAMAIGVVDEIIDPAAACPKHWPPSPPDAAPTATSRSDTRGGRRVAAGLNLVGADGGQVGEQAGEAVHRSVVVGAFTRGLGEGLIGRALST